MRLLKNIKKFLNNTGLTVLCVYGITFTVIVLWLQTSFVSPKLNAEQPSASALSQNTLDAFNQELTITLKAQHTEELKKLDIVSKQLQDITAGEETRQRIMRDLQETLDKVLAQQADRQTTPSPAPQAPVRSVNLIYAIDDHWDFAEDEIYNHLLQDHQFDATGYNLEQMTIIHDNLHAGYPALGNTPVSLYYVPQVQYYTAPVTRFRAGLFRSGFCLGGLCP